jgi:hypothetical protein
MRRNLKIDRLALGTKLRLSYSGKLRMDSLKYRRRRIPEMTMNSSMKEVEKENLKRHASLELMRIQSLATPIQT